MDDVFEATHQDVGLTAGELRALVRNETDRLLMIMVPATLVSMALAFVAGRLSG